MSSGDNAVLAIQITNPSLKQGFDALDISGSNNTIEGLDFTNFLINLSTVAGGNAISLKSGANNNLIVGNFFGVGLDGSSVGPNTNGVLVASNSNIIGGTTPGEANVISGSYWRDVELDGSLNTVEGNLIGTNAAGTKAAGAGTGRGSDNILVTGSNNTIGGTTAGAGNVISGGTGGGISVFAGAANAIFNNLIGTNASDEADDQGHGEGKTFLGRVTAAANGAWSLSLSPGQVTKGQQVTATATTTSNPLETSEFGANVVVTS